MLDDLDATVGEEVADTDTSGEVERPEPPDAGDAPTVQRGAVIGRYVVLGKLGAGAMGIVFAAYDPELDRKVAIKLLSPKRGREVARARLQREAQALAKLDHRNVVAVHDVGEHGGQSFVAMEFVEGQTLGAWMRAQGRPRPWREVVAVFVEAGRGLAAAHGAGLVHRDFKPENVMLGVDGRVRVMDFGLARTSQDERRDLEGSVHASADGSLESLTQTGVLMGTPAYMAPEQFEGRLADAASDQFGFCVALYEALHGARPFPSETLSLLIDAVTNGRVQAVAREASVPTWLRKVVLRGLARSPVDRWPSMQALLDALLDDPAVRRRKWWLGAGAVGLLGLATWGVLSSVQREPKPCTGMEERLAGVWDATRRGEVEAALRETGLERAGATWERVAVHLDAYADAWVAARVDACMATRGGEQSGDLLDRRMACLDERLAHLRATVDEFAHADAAMVDKAVQAVLSLPTLDRCADVEALMSANPPPEDPQMRERVAALEQRIVVAKAKNGAGKYGEALAIARAVVDDAEALGHVPVEARAWLVLGIQQAANGELAQAEHSFERAYDRALRERMLDEAAAASSWLTYLVGYDLGRPAEGRRWALDADPLSTAAGTSEARSAFLESVSALTEAAGDYDLARAQLLEALALLERVRGPDHLDLARLLNNLGIVADLQGQREQARAYYERALAIRVREQGPEHPLVGTITANLALVVHGEGKFAEARELYERALAIQEKTLGPDHPTVADTVFNLGELALAEGEYDEARERFERAMAIVERTQGAEHPAIAHGLDNLGRVARFEGKLEEARAYHERALAIRERSQGPEHPHVIRSVEALGEIAQELGEIDVAQAYFERAKRLEAASGSPGE